MSISNTRKSSKDFCGICGSDLEISRCKSCGVMTHDIHIPEGEIVCGKCGKVKT